MFNESTDKSGRIPPPPNIGLIGGDGVGETLSISAPVFFTDTRKFAIGDLHIGDVAVLPFAGISTETPPVSNVNGVAPIWCDMLIAIIKIIFRIKRKVSVEIFELEKII